MFHAAPPPGWRGRWAHFLKMDVLVYELSVLRGAGESLKATSVVFTEVLLDQFYKG